MSRPRWTPLLEDYATFHRLALSTGDVDPVYPVLVGVARTLEATEDAAAWLGLLHVAYYDLGSALCAYTALAWGADLTAEPLLALPCGTERRGHRDRLQLGRHLLSLHARAEGYGGAARWLRTLADDGEGRLSYRRLFVGLQQAAGNGRWAAYKTCELMFHLLHAYDPAWSGVEPDDMGHAYSTGPRYGLALLTALPPGNSSSAVTRLDELGVQLVDELHRRGLPATVATAETTLCDFHALHAGRYYPGHDIDQMAAQLRRAEDRLADFTAGEQDLRGRAGDTFAAAWNARATALPTAYLGERSSPGWCGVDKARCRLYRDSRVIAERGPATSQGEQVDTAAATAHHA